MKGLEQLSKEQLIKLVEEKEHEKVMLAQFIFKTFNAMGVKSFKDLDQVGKKVMSEIPKIMQESMFQKAKLKMRFMHFSEAQPLLERFKYLLPDD